MPALAGFSFDSPFALEYKTLLTQEMLKLGYLASTNCVCTMHTPSILDDYYSALDSVFSLIAECEAGLSVYSLLDGPVCHSGFQRLN